MYRNIVVCTLVFLLSATSLIAMVQPAEKLHAAVLANNLEKVKALLKNKPNIDKLDANYWCTALYTNVIIGEIDVLRNSTTPECAQNSGILQIH